MSESESSSSFRATVRFTFRAWDSGDGKAPAEVAESMAGGFSLDPEGLAEALATAEYEVEVVPDDTPTREADGTALCQSKSHTGTAPPVAVGTYDLEWDALDDNGEPGVTRTAIRNLCRDCRNECGERGVLATPHRFV